MAENFPKLMTNSRPHPGSSENGKQENCTHARAHTHTAGHIIPTAENQRQRENLEKN